MLDIVPDQFRLSNGIQVVYLRREAFVGHLGVMIQGGSRYENPDEEGLAHFLEHCIFKGTTKRKAFDIFTDLDCVGGELNAFTNKEEICVHASFRKNHFTIASELLGDIVQNASFPEDEILKEKEVVLDEIISYLDNPSERIFDEFEGLIFKGDSLGYNILGTEMSVKSFTRDHLLAYKDRYFSPSNIVISFVGDIPIDVLTEVLEKDFSQMKGGEVVKRKVDLNKFEAFDEKAKKANFQTHTLIGGRAPSYNDSTRRAMTLLTNVLGGPALNSRLILSIREKYGYAYNIEANYSSYSDSGIWNIYMGTDKKHLKKAIDLIYKELKLIREIPLTEKELEEGKEQLKGHIALSLDSNLELMFSQAKSIMIHGKVDSISDVYQQIDEITSQELLDVANDMFDVDNIAQLIYEY